MHLEEDVGSIHVVIVAEVGSHELQLGEVVRANDVLGLAVEPRQRHEILQSRVGR